MAQVNSERIFNNGKSKRQLITLITSGCSFSEPIIAKTWPLHLEKYLAPKNVNHLGLGSQGNGMISRKAIHAIHNALKTTSSKKNQKSVICLSFVQVTDKMTDFNHKICHLFDICTNDRQMTDK